MFNLIVSGDGNSWEAPPFVSPYSRFGEYCSEGVAESLDLNDPASVQALTEVPTLLLYEVGAEGPNVGVVRHGRVGDVIRRGRNIAFDFVPDPEHAYLLRQDLLARSAELDIARFERYRTHWAVKEGAIPREVIDAATPTLVQRTVESVGAEYGRAVTVGNGEEARILLGELEQFPPSIEKARAVLASGMAKRAVPELLALAGIEPNTPESRRAVEVVLARNSSDDSLPEDWAYSVAWFLDEYGSATEGHVREEHIRQCTNGLRELGALSVGVGDWIERIGFALWKCARSRKLVGETRREIAVLIDIVARKHDTRGFWTEDVDGSSVEAVRATALATVVLQRLGDDRFHGLLRTSVNRLLAHVQSDAGALPRYAGNVEPDLLATTFCMEALRRSDLADELSHVLAKGDHWIVSEQCGHGWWTCPPQTDDFATAVVLGYLDRRSDVLPQVDGFLLMARDFFRRGEELRLEGGANNRRLSAIAVVHAIEMFLYGVFEKRDDLGLSAYRDDGVVTLGPREALRELQDALQRIGLLPKDRRLPRRDQLSSLIGRRDGIIHRAHEISESELSKGIADARRFIELMGDDLLNLNLLE